MQGWVQIPTFHTVISGCKSFLRTTGRSWNTNNLQGLSVFQLKGQCNKKYGFFALLFLKGQSHKIKVCFFGLSGKKNNLNFPGWKGFSSQFPVFFSVFHPNWSKTTSCWSKTPKISTTVLLAKLKETMKIKQNIWNKEPLYV